MHSHMVMTIDRYSICIFSCKLIGVFVYVLARDESMFQRDYYYKCTFHQSSFFAVFNGDAPERMEIVDETRRVLFYVERGIMDSLITLYFYGIECFPIPT